MKLISYEEAAEMIGISYTHVSRKCAKLGIKCVVGRYGKKFLTEKQVGDLKPTYFMDVQIPTGNVVEVLKVTETYFIYESKMNRL